MKKNQKISDKINRQLRDYSYRRYRIISAFWNGQYHARAFNRLKAFQKFNGDDHEAVIQQLETFIDTHIENFKKCRTKDNIPCVAEYREALDFLLETNLGKQIKLLRSCIHSNDYTATLKELMQYAPCDELETINLFTCLGRQLSQFLNFKPEINELPANLRPAYVIATPQNMHNKSLCEWKLRPQFIDALKEVR